MIAFKESCVLFNVDEKWTNFTRSLIRISMKLKTIRSLHEISIELRLYKANENVNKMMSSTINNSHILRSFQMKYENNKIKNRMPPPRKK